MAVLCLLAIALGMLAACNGEVNTIPTYDTTDPAGTAVTEGATNIPTSDPSEIPVTPVFPTGQTPDINEVRSKLEEAVSNSDVNVISECVTIYPELMNEYKAGIETAVVNRAKEFAALCKGDEYGSADLSVYAKLPEFKDTVIKIFADEINALTNDYADDKAEDKAVSDLISRLYAFNQFAGELKSANEAFQSVVNDKTAYQNAEKEFNKGDTEKALQILSAIGEGLFYEKANKLADYIKADSKKAALLSKATARYALCDFDGAIANLESFLTKYPGDEKATDLLKKYKAEFEDFKKETELFPVSKVRSVFTHSLIAFPEAHLTSEPNAHGDKDCLTPKEYKAIIEALYRSGYVLIDYRLIYEVTEDENGNEILDMRKNIRVPKGKKPLIFSIDAVFSPDKDNGLTDKVILHEGRIASYTKLKNGQEIISYDNEVFGILETFLMEHPDFSFNGAKLVVAPTGYYGFLGHQTQKYSDYNKKTINPPEVRNKAIEEAKELIAYMLDNGYMFGSHTYSHPYMTKQTPEELREDLQAWQDEVGYLLGDVEYYIYPYGDFAKGTDRESLNYIIAEFGFKVFNGCGASCYNIKGFPFDRKQEVIFIDRFTLAGDPLRYYGQNKSSWVKEWGLLLTDGTTPKEIYDHENRYNKYGT